MSDFDPHRFIGCSVARAAIKRLQLPKQHGRRTASKRRDVPHAVQPRCHIDQPAMPVT